MFASAKIKFHSLREESKNPYPSTSLIICWRDNVTMRVLLELDEIENLIDGLLYITMIFYYFIIEEVYIPPRARRQFWLFSLIIAYELTSLIRLFAS